MKQKRDYRSQKRDYIIFLDNYIIQKRDYISKAFPLGPLLLLEQHRWPRCNNVYAYMSLKQCQTAQIHDKVSSSAVIKAIFDFLIKIG